LFTVVLLRLVFEAPLTPAQQPSLLILVAPSAVGLSTYIGTTGRLDLFAESLYWVTLYLLGVVLGRLRHLPACCPFRVAWWAVSFPLAASAVAALRLAQAQPTWWAHGVALVLVALSSVVIFGLLVRSVWGVARGELRALST
jgi:tellurite resistance protein